MAGKTRLMMREVVGRNCKPRERAYLHRVDGPLAFWRRTEILRGLMGFDVRVIELGMAVAYRANPDEVTKIFVIDESKGGEQ